MEKQKNMKNSFFRIIALVMAICAIACTFTSCNKEDTTNQKETETETESETVAETPPTNEITISLLAPLSGEYESYGIAIKNAAQMTVDEINTMVDGTDKLKLKLVTFDDKNDPKEVESAYASMINSKAQVSLGSIMKDPCLKFAELSAKDNMFFITPSIYDSSVTSAPNAFQMCTSNKNDGLTAAKSCLQNINVQKIGILYQADDNYSKTACEQFKESLSSTEHSLVEASFTASTATQFSQQIEQLKDCNTIFLPIDSSYAALFMTQAINIIDKATLYHGGSEFDKLISIKNFDITAIHQQIKYISELPPSNYVIATNYSSHRDFLEKYINTYGPDSVSSAVTNTYHSIQVIYQAINKAVSEGTKINSKTTPSELCEILKAQLNGDYKYNTLKFYPDYSIESFDNRFLSWNEDGSTDKETYITILKDEAFLIPHIMEKAVYYKNIVEVAEAAGASYIDLRRLQGFMKEVKLYEPDPGEELSEATKKMNEANLEKWPQLQRVKADGTVENVTLLTSEKMSIKEKRYLEELILKYCPNITHEFIENYYREIGYTPKLTVN